ncbi:21825_t:CDS:1, partial [Gigaspora rosea]
EGNDNTNNKPRVRFNTRKSALYTKINAKINLQNICQCNINDDELLKTWRSTIKIDWKISSNKNTKDNTFLNAYVNVPNN